MRREGTIEQLLHQGGMLLDVIEQQRALMEEHHVPLPVDLSMRYQEATSQQKKLASLVSAGKQLPPIGRELQVRKHCTVFWFLCLGHWYLLCVCVCVCVHARVCVCALTMYEKQSAYSSSSHSSLPLPGCLPNSVPL